MTKRLLPALIFCIIQANVVFAMNRQESISLLDKFEYLCKNIVVDYYEIRELYEGHDSNKLVFNVIERQKNSLDSLSIALLKSDKLPDIMKDIDCYDDKAHSHFYIAASKMKTKREAVIYTKNLREISDKPGSYEWVGQTPINLYETLRVLLKNADQLHAERESSSIFQKNYKLLKDKLNFDCTTYVPSNLANHIRSYFRPENSDASSIIQLLIDGSNQGKIDKEWLVQRLK